jgi:DNA topoisomerase-1
MPDPAELAESAGLIYFSDEKPGIRREGAPGDFTYTKHNGEPVRDEATLERISLRGLPREKVLATVVHLLETTLIRVGNEDYVKQNKSYGLTTLRNPHIEVDGSELRFNFKGKAGKSWRLRIRHRRVAKVVKACQELPGQRLFEYMDESGEPREVTSADVNAYLREITEREITAKDFRTWAGTVLAALPLNEPESLGQQAREHVRTVASADERLFHWASNDTPEQAHGRAGPVFAPGGR